MGDVCLIRSDALAGAPGSGVTFADWVCRFVGWLAEEEEGSTCLLWLVIVTGTCLSSGGSGGSTGSSAGTTTSIPWCSGTEWNLGRCFGNQGGSWSAVGEIHDSRMEMKLYVCDSRNSVSKAT